MKTGYVNCGYTLASGRPCGAQAELVESRYTYGKVRNGSGQLVDQLQRIDYHVNCPVCGDHWEVVPVTGKAASA